MIMDRDKLVRFHTPKAINSGSLIAYPYLNLSPCRGRLKTNKLEALLPSSHTHIKSLIAPSLYPQVNREGATRLTP